jgi:putative hydrolase of HD superfamily
VTVDRIADFLFEVGMLKRTPRTGWQFLAGAEQESVADHSFRVALIAIVLSRMEDGESTPTASSAWPWSTIFPRREPAT